MIRCGSCRVPMRSDAPLCATCGAPRPSRRPLPGPVRQVLLAMLVGAGALGTGLALWWTARPFIARLTPDPVRSAIARLPGVLNLTAYAESGHTYSQGSGFLVGKEGLALTDYHVLAGAVRVEAALADGRSFDVTGVESYDPVRDVCVFRIGRVWDTTVEPPPAGIAPLELRLDAPARPGERVVVLGSPKGFANSLSDGLVSALRTEDGRDFVQFTAPISRGSSGSPLLDARGRVVGMVVATGTDAQNLNFAIPAGALAPFVAERSGWTLQAVREQAREVATRTIGQGDSLLARGDFAGALVRYSHANDFDPNAIDALVGMTLCCRLLGDEEQATRWAAALEERVPDAKRRLRLARAKLKALDRHLRLDD